MLLPPRVSVPGPVLVSPPGAADGADEVGVPAVSNVPPPAPSVMARSEFTFAPVVCSVPPPKASAPAASPRLLSAETESVPPLMVVPPV